MANLGNLYQPSIMEQAQAGNFRAIAYWLNSELVAQQIYAQVKAAHPGCLRVLVEFHRPPNRDRLTRFICHRLWCLNSDVIEGVQIVARCINQARPLWQQSIRITTPASRQRRQQLRQPL
ncbi:MAG: CapA family protein, partial [Cyanothece sp. SIO1E1]|nr:CapA family protein [Cyanothece sp. SIO1E1]